MLASQTFSSTVFSRFTDPVSSLSVIGRRAGSSSPETACTSSTWLNLVAIKQSRLCGSCKCNCSTNSSSDCITSSRSSLISLESRFSRVSVLALSSSRSQTDFGQVFNCVKIVQMAWSAASARALLAASPIASVEPPAIGERITEWLKITAVPLLVFLIGACIWGCIQNTAAWRVLTEDGGGSTHNEALGEVRSDSPRAVSNNEAAEDLETGLELSQVRCRDEESDSRLKSTVTACSVATNAAMDGNVRPNSDIGDAVGPLRSN